MSPLFAPPFMAKISLGIISSIEKNVVQFHTKLVLLVSRHALPDSDPDRGKKKSKELNMSFSGTFLSYRFRVDPQ